MPHVIDPYAAAKTDLARLETKLDTLKETTERELNEFNMNMKAGLAKASASTKEQLARARGDAGEGLDKVRSAMKGELDKAVTAARAELGRVAERLSARMADMKKELDDFGATAGQEQGRLQGAVREEPAGIESRLAALKAKLEELKNATKAALARTEKKLDEMDRRIAGMDESLVVMGANKEEANAKLDMINTAMKTNQNTLAAAVKSNRNAARTRLTALKWVGALLVGLMLFFLARIFELI